MRRAVLALLVALAACEAAPPHTHSYSSTTTTESCTLPRGYGTPLGTRTCTQSTCACGATTGAKTCGACAP